MVIFKRGQIYEFDVSGFVQKYFCITAKMSYINQIILTIHFVVQNHGLEAFNLPFFDAQNKPLFYSLLKISLGVKFITSLRRLSVKIIIQRS